MPTDRSRILIGILLSLTTYGCATTATVRGRLILGPGSEIAATDSIALAARTRETVRDAVVYLDPSPRLPASKAPRTAVVRMTQRNRRFVPHVVAVPAGSSVRFENHDSIYHRVFSVSPVKTFDLGNCAPGRFKTVTFDSTGVVQVFCEVESRMSGFVFVTPASTFVRPDSSGAFQLKLPRGDYTIHVWHPSRGDLKRDVQVTGRGATVSLTF